MKITRRRLRSLIREVLNEQGVLDQALAALPELPTPFPAKVAAEYAPGYEDLVDIRKKDFILNPMTALDNIRNDKAVQREVDIIVDVIDDYADSAQIGLTTAGIGSLATPAAAASPFLVGAGAIAGGSSSMLKLTTALAKGEKSLAAVALAELFADITIVASVERAAANLAIRSGAYDALVRALTATARDFDKAHLIAFVSAHTGFTALIQELLVEMGETLEALAKNYESAQRDESDEKISVEETKEMARRLMNLVPQIEAQPHPLGPGEDI